MLYKMMGWSFSIMTVIFGLLIIIKYIIGEYVPFDAMILLTFVYILSKLNFIEARLVK